MKQTFTILMLIASVATAHGQIIIDELPLPLGIGAYTQYSTSNADGSNTVAINALIAQSGADQVYDLTGITYEDLFEGPYAILEGAVGPGAEIEPLNLATRTLSLPFNQDQDGQTVEGVIFDYVQEVANTAYNLGGFFEGTLNGNPTQFTTTRTLPGDPEFVLPVTFGATWSAEFTESTSFGGSSFDTDLTKTYEVDGWGTMLVPNVETPIEVLRVKVTETRTVGGFDFDTVCYDLRANGTVAAGFCEGEFDKAPTANVTVLVPGATDVAEGLPARAATLHPVYPNPVAENAILRYDLSEAADVDLAVYDVLGRAVYSAPKRVYPPGSHSLPLSLQGLAPGLYVVQLQVGGTTQTRPFTVVR